MSNRIKKFDGGGEVGGGGFAWELAQEMASPELGMISDAQYTDRIISMIEDGYYYGQTPEQLAAADLGLSVAQMNAKTEDMLDSILSSQGENETGFVNESAKLAAEGILKGKIAQAGVTDPAAQEAALKSGMESLESGGSGLDAVKAAAGGAQDFVEELLKTAKDAVDAGYDKLADFLPEGAMPDTVGIDPTTGQTTAVWGKTSGTPVLGGTVGTQGGGTYAGITTTGSAIVDKLIKVIKEGGSASSVISASTGLPGDVVDAAVAAAKTVKEGIEKTTLDGNDPSKVVLTTTGSEALDPNSENRVLTAGDTNKEVLGDGVTTTTGDEIINPNSANQTLTLNEKVVTDDKVNTGSEWVNQGAGGFDEVVGSRKVGDFFGAGEGPDDEVVGPRITGDPFTFTPVLDEEEPPESPPEVPVLDEVPPEPPPEVPEIPTVTRVPLTRTIRREPGDLVDIDYLYDISGPSIFAPILQGDEDADKNRPYIYSGFADGGIVKEYDLEQLLKKIRG